MLPCARDHGGSKGARRIHGSAADSPGEHCFQCDHRPDRDAGGDALFFCASGNVQNHKHEDERENELENEGLRLRTCGKSAAERGVIGKEELERKARGDCTSELAENVGKDLGEGESAGEGERESDGGIQMSAGDVADGVNHGEDDQAEGERNPDMCDCASA